jgi:hypothetical protein
MYASTSITSLVLWYGEWLRVKKREQRKLCAVCLINWLLVNKNITKYRTKLLLPLPLLMCECVFFSF